MSGPLQWEREGRIWPHRDASRFVQASGLIWHVQRMAPSAAGAPQLLLLHGTGASVHSWHGVMPFLAQGFDVLAMDLPGHAFTRGKPAGGLTLRGMVAALAGLLEAEGFEPDLVGGHSAGAAIGLEWACAHGRGTPIVGLNPAIMPFAGPAAQIFPAMAKLLLVNPFVPRVFAGLAKVPGEAARFLRRSTGSRTDPVSEACYAALFANHRHARGALEMMANWDLEALKRQLPGVANPVLLLHGTSDTAVPLSSVRQASALLPNATLDEIAGAGHLMHEERPEEIAQRIEAFAVAQGIMPSRQREDA